MIVTLIALAGGALLLLLLARYDETAVRQDWETLMAPVGRQAYERLRERFDQERRAVNFTFERAESLARDEPDEAIRLLQAGCHYMDGLRLDRGQMLKLMARYSRMISAITPLPPVRPHAFRLWRIAVSANLGRIAHRLLASASAFRLRTKILGRGQGIVLQTLRRAGRHPGGDWELASAARDDWHAISEETLASFRALVSPYPNASVVDPR